MPEKRNIMKDDNSNTNSFGYGLVLRLFAMFSIPLFLSAAIERFGPVQL
jgi:hypothetical protein